ncbi:MAG: hypothetical protein WC796_03305 [Candidatus Pacearchaeota archaeon]
MNYEIHPMKRKINGIKSRRISEPIGLVTHGFLRDGYSGSPAHYLQTMIIIQPNVKGKIKFQLYQKSYIGSGPITLTNGDRIYLPYERYFREEDKIDEITADASFYSMTIDGIYYTVRVPLRDLCGNIYDHLEEGRSKFHGFSVSRGKPKKTIKVSIGDITKNRKETVSKLVELCTQCEGAVPENILKAIMEKDAIEALSQIAA